MWRPAAIVSSTFVVTTFNILNNIFPVNKTQDQCLVARAMCWHLIQTLPIVVVGYSLRWRETNTHGMRDAVVPTVTLHQPWALSVYLCLCLWLSASVCRSLSVSLSLSVSVCLSLCLCRSPCLCLSVCLSLSLCLCLCLCLYVSVSVSVSLSLSLACSFARFPGQTLSLIHIWRCRRTG